MSILNDEGVVCSIIMYIARRRGVYTFFVMANTDFLFHKDTKDLKIMDKILKI